MDNNKLMLVIVAFAALVLWYKNKTPKETFPESPYIDLSLSLNPPRQGGRGSRQLPYDDRVTSSRGTPTLNPVNPYLTFVGGEMDDFMPSPFETNERLGRIEEKLSELADIAVYNQPARAAPEEKEAKIDE